MTLRTAVVYGSSGGTTAEVAKRIVQLLPQYLDVQVAISDIRDANLADLSHYDLLLLGSSTWNWGDLQDDWESKFDVFSELELQGVKVGFFGCGDSYCYADTFGDALGILWEAAEVAGAMLVGSMTVNGYSFSDSRAVHGTQLVGVLLDQDNEPELTDERLERWLDALARDVLSTSQPSATRNWEGIHP